QQAALEPPFFIVGPCHPCPPVSKPRHQVGSPERLLACLQLRTRRIVRTLPGQLALQADEAGTAPFGIISTMFLEPVGNDQPAGILLGIVLHGFQQRQELCVYRGAHATTLEGRWRQRRGGANEKVQRPTAGGSVATAG